MTVDTILILFSLIVLSVILAIVMVGGLIFYVREFGHDPWTLAKLSFPGTFTLVLVWGATEGIYFISPTDGWVEIITEALAFSLMVMAVEVI